MKIFAAMESTRQLKYAKLVQKEISEIFQKEGKEATNGVFMTVTAVKMSPDLSFAKVYLSLIEEKNRQQNFDNFLERKSEIRKYLGKRIGKQVRIIPEIAFVLDDTEDKAARMDTLISQLHIPPAEPED